MVKVGSRKVSSGRNFDQIFGGYIERTSTRGSESKKVKKSTKKILSTGRRPLFLRVSKGGKRGENGVQKSQFWSEFGLACWWAYRQVPNQKVGIEKSRKIDQKFFEYWQEGGSAPPFPTLVCQNVKKFFVDFLRFDDSYHVFGCRGICGAKNQA